MSQPKPIILIEDEEMHIRLFERSIRRLKSLDLVVSSAKNGQEGVQLINNFFATNEDETLTVLLDLNMPVMDGFKVMEYINDKPYRSQINLIILTTSDDIGDLDTAKALGYDYYMVKPIDYEMLESMINQA